MTRLGRLFILASGVSLLTGCPNPNTFGTPRTVPKGKFNHIITAEGASLSSTTTTTVNGQTTSYSDSITLPIFPSYHLRYGVADDADIGFKVLNLDSIGADVKWNFERGDAVDFAMNPAVQATLFDVGGESLGLVYFHLPLLVGFNLSDDLTLVATPGVTFLFATSKVSDSGASTQEQAVGTGSALLGRLGIGLNARLADKFAIQPEVTALRGFNDAKDTYITFGLGFIIGPHPVYGPTPAQ